MSGRAGGAKELRLRPIWFFLPLSSCASSSLPPPPPRSTASSAPGWKTTSGPTPKSQRHLATDLRHRLRRRHAEPRAPRSRHAGRESQDAEEAAPGRVRLAGQLFRRKDRRRGDRRRAQPRRQVYAKTLAGIEKSLRRAGRRRARHLGPRIRFRRRRRSPTTRSRCSAPRPSCRPARTCSARRCWPPSRSSSADWRRRGQMKSSWAGALGQPQFLPSSFLKHAVDFDGDGRRDIWNSDADAMASIANYLVDYGWVRGRDWGFEVTRAGRRLLRAGRSGPGQAHFGLGQHGHRARQRQAVPGQRGELGRLSADACRPQRAGLYRHAEFLRAQGVQ